MKYKTYLVGGAVRDEILGRPNKDLDFVMLAPSFNDMRDALLADGCKIFVEKPEYLTIRANHPKLGAVDFACARKDGNYSDGRRPDSTEITTDLVADLSRRDFTCNALAKDVDTGEIIDPFNGRRDIQDKMLVAVGNPITRITEDKLRAFRALRFSVTRSFIMDYPLTQAIRYFSVPSDYRWC
jgi:tRNA nucleotidyltransferase (CCA-adding enzyme)